MKNEGLRTLTSKKSKIQAENHLGMKFKVKEREVLGREETGSVEIDQGGMRENCAKRYIQKIIKLNRLRDVEI